MLRGLLILAAVMGGIAIVYYGVGIVAMARMLLRPRRMDEGRALWHLQRLSPADLGLEFENVGFDVIDESNGRKLHVAGWWIGNPDARGRCAVILHGYSDAKVGGIAWAPLLRELGFAILAIDLRAHGDSGGAYCTGGYWERQDVNQVLDQLKAARPGETRQILLFGISLGAAVAAATAALRSDLWAVILECPFSSFHNAAKRHGTRIGTPGPFFQEPAFALAKWMSGADMDAVRPVDTIPKISCPVMVIQSCDDPFLSDEDRAAVRQALESRGASQAPSVCWELPNTHHIVGMRENPVEYRRRIEDFLSRVLQNTVAVCDK
ncbi:MAG TPA: alpha/beta fold hydrolase [Tepidisphaeraceae bacterium]|jgi:pimeloyl-ACP methyl ester carboxylesterase|nr:alpha/beta fold hydrolase [Tepidisphaeraceae bacterium]